MANPVRPQRTVITPPAPPTLDEILERLNALSTENAALREQVANGRSRGGAVNFTVGPKGTLTLWGIRSRGIAFYADEWVALLRQQGAIEAALKENAAKLAGPK